MRYESLLAGRYIKAQKRQSVFTVLSIVMAVATMTVIFVLCGVSLHNARMTALEQAPYHLALEQWPANKATALRNEKHVESVTFSQNPDGSLTAWIFFDRNIGNSSGWLSELAKKNGVELTVSHAVFDENGVATSSYPEDLYDWNYDLMALDLVTDDAIFHMLLLFLVMLLFALLFCFALRLLVDTAFEISSKERERHYGVLQSIGATPKQIVGIITREGLRLCLLAIPLGLGVGTLIAYLMFRSVLSMGTIPRLGPEPVFSFSPLMLVTAAVVGIIWTFFSAYGVGMRVVKRTPIDAIQGRAKRVEKVKRRSLSGLLFGLPGKLAARNARREKKRFRITVLALTVSIVLFALFSFLTDSIEAMLLESYRGGIDSDFFLFLQEDPEEGIQLMDEVRVLEDSGLFQSVEIKAMQFYYTDHIAEDGRQDSITAFYCNPDQYRRLMGDHPAVSYEALAQSRGYVFVDNGEQDLSDLDDEDWEYYAQREELRFNYRADAEAGRMKIYSRYYDNPDEKDPEKRPHEIQVCAVDEVKEQIYYPGGLLVSTLETYSEIKNEWFGQHADFVSADLYCGPVETHNYGEYRKITDFLRAHSDYFEDGEYYDHYLSVLETKSTMAAIRTAFLCLNLLLGLAALVNLLNIVSTGIANRRSELASLQCVGMTEGQLFRLSAVECLQYVLLAAVSSAAVVGAILYGVSLIVNRLAEETKGVLMGDTPRDMLDTLLHLNYATPFLRIVLVAAAAFALSFAAAWIMLRSQNRYSLSARVRGEAFDAGSKPTEIG